MKQKSKSLIPPDLLRCQVEIETGSFMTLGPRSMERCKSMPSVVVTELTQGADGQYGAMSMCLSCFDVFRGLKPGWKRTYAMDLLPLKINITGKSDET